MLTDKNEEAKYYTVQHRVVAQTITGGNQTYQATDIFNGKVPLRFYIVFLETDNFDGSWVNNCFYFKWHQLNYVSVKKNSNLIHPEIKDSKDAYDMLVKHMNRHNKEMPFPYEDYENGYAIIMYDLDPHQSSYLQTLSLTTMGNLSVDSRFTSIIYRRVSKSATNFVPSSTPKFIRCIKEKKRDGVEENPLFIKNIDAMYL